MNKKGLLIKIFTISFLLLFFSKGRALACWCEGNVKKCYYNCLEKTGVVSPLVTCGHNDVCSGSQVCILSGIYPNYSCCSVSSTTCSCGCSGGSCNATCSEGWTGGCTNGTYYSSTPTDKYVCGSRTYRFLCCSTSDYNCWCNCGCTPGAAASCPAGTKEATTTDYYNSYSTCCNRDHGASTETCNPDQSCNYRDCYCDICTLPLCSTTSYAGSNQGWGSLIATSCRNGTSSTPDRNSKCDLRTRTCYCYKCEPPSCPSGTSETQETATSPSYSVPAGVSDYHSSPSCTNDCKVGNDRDCYCAICTPATCASQGYLTSMQYSPRGNSQGDIVLSCRNGNSSTPNRTTKCSLTYRDCYCPYCGKNCPSPLTNTGNANLILTNFRMCTNDCSVSPINADRHCYEPSSPQPTESLAVNINTSDSNRNQYGFRSTKYSGLRNDSTVGDLNDPVTMTATYLDESGRSDMEGLFVWFRDVEYTGTPATPIRITTGAPPKSATNDSWGFMVRKVAGSWRPFVPSYSLTPAAWTRVSTNILDGTFYIPNTNGQNMVGVKVDQIAPVLVGLTEGWEMKFTLKFSNISDNNIITSVEQTNYNVRLMGLDKFSFTPYDNYAIDYGSYWTSKYERYPDTNLSHYWAPNYLRYKESQNQLYARDWSPIKVQWQWGIDRVPPSVSTHIETLPDKGLIKFEWTASDTDANTHSNLYAIVGNIYYSRTEKYEMKVSVDPLTEGVDILDEYDGLDNNRFVPQDQQGVIGRLNDDAPDVPMFIVHSDMSSNSHSGIIYIDPGGNREGPLDVYLTVFDDAGNIGNCRSTMVLDDWFVTDGGLAYSASGTKYVSKVLGSSTDWISPSRVLPPVNYGSGESLIPSKADLSSEMWSNDSSLNDLIASKVALSKAYSIDSHVGHSIGVAQGGYYGYLQENYEKNKKTIPTGELVELDNDDLETITGIRPFNNFAPSNRLTDYCGTSKYCLIDYTGILNVNQGNAFTMNQGFRCDGQSVIFVDGDLNINPNIDNSGEINQNACIFVVSGNVNIKEGRNSSAFGSFRYDSVNAYILADGEVTIEHESSKDVDEIFDGVYINGGIHSLAGFNQVERYLQFIDRLQYPAVAIDYHPKYGVTAETFFGKPARIQRIEVAYR